MFEEIPGNVPEDSGDVSKDSGEACQRFSRMLKKIEHFIIQLNENRIKGYILSYNQNITCEWACVSIITYFISLRNNEPVHKALTMKL